MAHVYLARDLRHNRHVALKVLRPEIADSVGADRFLQEIQIAASLQHPNILPLYDSGRADGLLYYTMPYLEGKSLRQRLIREKQLPLEDVVAVGRDVAEALSYAHSRGVVHRDIKPENVLFSGQHALVADFGIAHAVTEAGGERLTTAGIAVGTPAYMSPEQATGETAIDARSDIYSLGIVAYEMLTGEPPFTGVTPGAILARQATERVPSIEVVRPNVPHEMVEVVEKALAKVPADRYRTAQAFADALSKGVTAKVRLFRPLLRRRRARMVGAGLVLAAVLIITQLVTRWPAGLDPNVILSFPLEWSGGTAEFSAGVDRLPWWGVGNSLVVTSSTSSPIPGENAAYAIVALLDGKGDFTWVPARDLLDDRYRQDIGLLSRSDRSALARSQGAAHYVDGRIIPEAADSVRVFLELHRTSRARWVRRVNTAGPASDVNKLAVQAAAEVLLELMPDGASIDVSDIAQANPQAVQIMVQAEREFHAGRFERALELYREAVQADSGFALAAARGAQAASWNHRYDEARDLIGVATRNLEPLAPRWVHFALGFEAYLNGQADSAVAHFGGAIQSNERWREGWMGLGETYQHLLPSVPSTDSLARDAFEQVYILSQGFAPGLYHLVEFAIRERELTRAARLLEEYRSAEPDTAVLANLELAFSVPKTDRTTSIGAITCSGT
jgi:serine/threonine protein kinase/tetratricopeptide (TPR) repeat protein